MPQFPAASSSSSSIVTPASGGKIGVKQGLCLLLFLVVLVVVGRCLHGFGVCPLRLVSRFERKKKSSENLEGRRETVKKKKKGKRWNSVSEQGKSGVCHNYDVRVREGSQPAGQLSKTLYVVLLVYTTHSTNGALQGTAQECHVEFAGRGY